MPRQINKIPRVCPTCSKTFLAWPHEVRASQARFCSRECFHAAKLPRSKRGTNHVQRLCEICQKTFLAKPSEIQRRGGKYCSRACYQKGKTIPIGRLFLRNVSEPNEQGCMLWTGTISNGYGRLKPTREKGSLHFPLAHRYAFEMAYGPIPEGMSILHLCDVPACVNPVHLALGTAADNCADKVAKGRHLKGEKCWFSKLTADDVRAIRRRYDAGEASQIQLAKEYGMTNTNISHIVRRLSWKHVL